MSSEVREVARQLMNLGYRVVPLNYASKKPVDRQWQSTLYEPDDLDVAFPEQGRYGIGLLTGVETSERTYVTAIDIDVEDPVLIGRVRSAFPFGTVFSAKRGMKGITFFCRTADPVAKQNIRVRGEARARIEILGRGQHTVLPPSIHPDTNDEYEWIEGSPLHFISPESLPVLTAACRDEIMLAVIQPDSKIFYLNIMEWLGPGGGGSVHNSTLEAVGLMVQRNWTNDDITSRVSSSIQRLLHDSPYADQWDARQFDLDLNSMIKGARDKGFDRQGPKKGSKSDKIRDAALDFIAAIGEEHICSMDGVFRIYRDGWWREVSRGDLGRMVIRQPDIRAWAIASDAMQIADTIILQSPRWEGQRHDMIATRHDAVDLATGERFSHSPDFGLTYCLPFDYDPSARCPKYDEFVRVVFSARDVHSDDIELSVQLWNEYAGLTFVNDTSFQKSLIIEGEPASGKSTLTFLLQNMHAPDSHINLDLFDLRSERTTSSLAGKLVAFTHEISPDDYVPSDIFKMVVDGATIPTRRLYAEKVDVQMTARLVIACNEKFKYRDGSGAMERRMMFLMSRPTVPEEQRDRGLLRSLEAEKAGIFNRWVDGLLRLRRRNDFLLPSVTRQQRAVSVETNNPAWAWFLESTHEGMKHQNPQYEYEPNGGTENAHLYQSYVEYAQRNGHKVMNSITLGMRLSQLGYPARVIWSGGTKGRAIKVRDVSLLGPVGAAEGDY